MAERKCPPDADPETCFCHVTPNNPAGIDYDRALVTVMPQGVTDQMTYRAAAELHHEMCGCAASEDTGEGVPWCDSIWPVRARRIVVAALRQEQER